MPEPRKLKPKVQALQRDTAALLKLLGGNDNDQLRYWEIVKGITTPIQLRLVEQQIDVMQNLILQVQTTAKGLEKSAKEISAGTVAAKAASA
jgi:hypothetical protein